MADLLERLQQALADRYSVGRELGQGGMATVYLAEDLRHHRQVALKVLKPEIAAVLGAERFLKEIEVTAGLHHPHILPLYDSGGADGQLFYVMPYVEGESLRERLSREKQLPLEDALRVTQEVADALSYAHSHGVVHRDIKPENILLESGHAVVADFGIARALTAAGGTRLTETGLAVGTPAYMSPEQATGSHDLDGRSDLYSLGCVLYEMLVGETPYTGPTPQAILARKLSEPLPRVSVVRETVPAGVEAVLDKALSRTPADRWATAAEFAAALEHPELVVATPGRGTAPATARPATRARLLPRPARWTAGIAAAAAIAVLAVVGGPSLLHRPLDVTVSDVTPVTSEPGVEFEPAISPDGQEVAYVAGSIDRPRLFVRSTANVAGQAAIRLGDTGPGSEWLPWWTADGQSVRFLDCGLKGFGSGPCAARETGKLGGTVRAVTVPRGARWAWSPDDSRIASVFHDSIFVASATDTVRHLVAIPDSAGFDIHSLAWSPDGRRIAYVSGNSMSRVGANVDVSVVRVIDLRGGAGHRVSFGSGCRNFSPAWLDDQHLLFVSDTTGIRSLYVVQAGKNGARGAPRPVPGITDLHSVSYSIASRRLAFAKFTNRQNIWSYPLDRSAPLSIRDGTPVTTGANLIETNDVSPDGQWIVFDNALRARNMDLFKVPAAGGEAVPLESVEGQAFGPRWSPDGRDIAFYGGNVDGISVLPAEGGAPSVAWQDTLHTSWNVDPAWSPDGLAITFIHIPPRAGPQTWIVRRDSLGGHWHEPRLLMDPSFGVTAWAPDGSGALAPGRRLMRHSSWDFVSPEGRTLWHRDLAASYGLTLYGGVARYSRDGRTIYVAGEHRDGRRGVWAIPVGPGRPRLVIAFDDPALANALGALSVGPDRLYLTVAEYESDIWVAKLKY
jgi:Tol biopolymer transport system component